MRVPRHWERVSLVCLRQFRTSMSARAKRLDGPSRSRLRSLASTAVVVAAASRVACDVGTPLINACYPDAVNVVLYGPKQPATCGIGNAAIIESFCRGNTEPA